MQPFSADFLPQPGEQHDEDNAHEPSDQHVCRIVHAQDKARDADKQRQADPDNQDQTALSDLFRSFRGIRLFPEPGGDASVDDGGIGRMTARE